MKKNLHLIILALCALFCGTASAKVVKTVVLSESFANCSEGSLAEPSAVNIYDAATGVIASEYTTQAGWKFVDQGGNPATGTLVQAGGAIFMSGSTNCMLQSPTIDWSKHADQTVYVTFEARIAGESEDVLFNLRASGVGKGQAFATLNNTEWTTVTAKHSCGDDKGTIRLDAGADVYIRNLTVSVNADGAGFVGDYSFTSNCEVLFEAVAHPTDGAFSFSIADNEGEDAEAYPFLVKGFMASPGFSYMDNDMPGIEPNDLKACYGPDLQSLVIDFTGDVNQLNGAGNSSAHLDVYAADAKCFAIVPKADGTYGIEGDYLKIVQHTPEQNWIFGVIPESFRDCSAYTNIVISKQINPEVLNVVGTYYFKGNHTALAENALSREKGWGFVDGIGTFEVVANDADDAAEFPVVLKGFLGTESFAVSDVKARLVDGNIAIPQGKTVALTGSATTSPRAFLGTAVQNEDGSYAYAADAKEDIVLVADEEGKLVPNQIIAVCYHEDGIAFFGVPDTDKLTYAYPGAFISTEEIVGIDTVLAPAAASAIYNLSGQRVNRNTRGIVIEGGRVVIR